MPMAVVRVTTTESDGWMMQLLPGARETEHDPKTKKWLHVMDDDVMDMDGRLIDVAMPRCSCRWSQLHTYLCIALFKTLELCQVFSSTTKFVTRKS
jgi:hypothetical protein